MKPSPELLGASKLRAALDRHGVRPSRSLGQNFVIDPNTIRKVVALARLSRSDRVLEVGAGAGSLTLALAESCDAVVALEKDPRLIAVLHDVLSSLPHVEVVEGDALAVELSSFRATRLVANLPYNVAASVVIKTLETAPGIEELTVMTQKEVGERLASGPGSKVYGQTSVLVAYYGSAEVVAPVSRRAFYPVPGVDSVVVRIARRPGIDRGDLAPFSSVVKTAFSQRRKALRKTLVPLFGSTEEASRALDEAKIDPLTRPEDLGLEGYLALASLLRRP